MIASLFCCGGTSMVDGWLLCIPILFSACPVHPLNLHSHPWPVHPSIFHVVSFQSGLIKHETITGGHHKGRSSEESLFLRWGSRNTFDSHTEYMDSYSSWISFCSCTDSALVVVPNQLQKLHYGFSYSSSLQCCSLLLWLWFLMHYLAIPFQSGLNISTPLILWSSSSSSSFVTHSFISPC